MLTKQLPRGIRATPAAQGAHGAHARSQERRLEKGVQYQDTLAYALGIFVAWLVTRTPLCLGSGSTKLRPLGVRSEPQTRLAKNRATEILYRTTGHPGIVE